MLHFPGICFLSSWKLWLVSCLGLSNHQICFWLDICFKLDQNIFLQWDNNAVWQGRVVFKRFLAVFIAQEFYRRQEIRGTKISILHWIQRMQWKCVFKKMVMTRGKVGLYSNAMAAQAIKPKKAAGRSQRTRRWSKNFGLLANFVFLLSSSLSYLPPESCSCSVCPGWASKS